MLAYLFLFLQFMHRGTISKIITNPNGQVKHQVLEWNLGARLFFYLADLSMSHVRRKKKKKH